jgi:hypothetical protein
MSSYKEALARWLYPVPNPTKILLWKGFFGPSPDDLVPFLDSAKTYSGEDSYEYAHELMEFGEACLAESSRIRALESYEQALSIYRLKGIISGFPSRHSLQLDRERHLVLPDAADHPDHFWKYLNHSC